MGRPDDLDRATEGAMEKLNPVPFGRVGLLVLWSMLLMAAVSVVASVVTIVLTY